MKLTQIRKTTGNHLKWTASVAFGIMAFLPARADYESAVQAFSPPGYWRLNETTPSVEDPTAYNIGSGSGLSGAFVNFPTKGVTPALAGPSGTAVSFNGTNQRMLVPFSSALNPPAPWTAEVWLEPASLLASGDLRCAFSSGQFASPRSGWLVYQDVDKWNLRTYSGVGTGIAAQLSSASGTASAGAWHHLVIVNDGTTLHLYVDGAEVGAGVAIGATVSGASGGTCVGARADSGFYWPGAADEFAIYPAALSAADVTAHYTNGLDAGRTTPYETLVGTSSPVSYYRLDEPAFVPPVAANIGTVGALADGPYGAGTANNQPGPTASGLGVGNVACQFTGTGQISCGADTGLDVTQISVAAWIKVDAVVPDMTVIAKGADLWRLQLGANNNLTWTCPGGGVMGSANVADGLWHYVVAVSGADGSALYVDGVLDTSDATPVATIAPSADPLTIGAMNGTAKWWGSLDEVTLFGSALTAQQAQDLYLASEPPLNDILSFGPGATITGTNILWKVPAGTDVTRLAPTYTLSFQATCDIPSGSVRNFSNPVSYTVNSIKTYAVTVELAPLPVIAGLACWYDASQGVTTDGTGVLTWNDRSGNGHVATRASGAPSLVPDDINSKSSVQLRGGSCFLDCAGPMFIKEQYVVVRSPSPTWNGSGSFIGRKSSDFLSVRPSSHNLFSGQTGFWDDILPSSVSKDGTAVSSSPGTMPRGGFELVTITNYMILKIVVGNAATPLNLATYPYNQIGRTETLTSSDMDIAEIIGYSTTNTVTDEVKIGNYLAEKYGISTAYPPAPPNGLVATSEVGKIDLNWAAVFGATGYDVMRSTTSGSGYATVGTAAGTAYTDSSVQAGTTYFYVVTATNSIATSANSAEVSGIARPYGTTLILR